MTEYFSAAGERNNPERGGKKQNYVSAHLLVTVKQTASGFKLPLAEFVLISIITSIKRKMVCDDHDFKVGLLIESSQRIVANEVNISVRSLIIFLG